MPPAVPDLFGAHYCIDTYFVQRVFPRVFARFGERSLTARLTVQPGQTIGDGPDALEHLACRYYRLDPAEKTTRVQVTLEAQALPAKCFLKAALVAVGEDQQPQQTVFLQRAAGSMSGTRLQGEILFPGPSSHVGLVVANVFVPARRALGA